MPSRSAALHVQGDEVAKSNYLKVNVMLARLVTSSMIDASFDWPGEIDNAIMNIRPLSYNSYLEARKLVL